MNTIEIANLTKTVRYEVAHECSPDRFIVLVDGLYVFADRTNGVWQLSGTPPNEGEKAILLGLLESNGTLDNTIVTVTPPETP